MLEVILLTARCDGLMFWYWGFIGIINLRGSGHPVVFRKKWHGYRRPS